MGVQGLKRIGLGITAIWVGVIVVYVWLGVEPENRPWNLAPNNFGDFLAGTVGPVAFFWLMLAFFIQSAQLEAQSKSVIAQEEALKATQQAIELQRQSLDMQRVELELQRKELELQRIETAKIASEASIQAGALKSNELHVRRQVYMESLNYITAEQSRLVFRLFSFVHGYSESLQAKLWKLYADGDRDVFFDKYFEFVLSREEVDELLDATKLRLSSIVDVFCSNFESLQEAAVHCGDEHQMLRALELSVMFAVYIVLSRSAKRKTQIFTRNVPSDTKLFIANIYEN